MAQINDMVERKCVLVSITITNKLLCVELPLPTLRGLSPIKAAEVAIKNEFLSVFLFVCNSLSSDLYTPDRV
jgi:hypothetical protein